MARKPTDEVQLKLRFSEALRRRIDKAAARNIRSMNTEIVHRVQESLDRDQGDPITVAVRSFIESVDKLYGLRGVSISFEKLGLDSLESLNQKLTSINEVLERSLLELRRQHEDDGEQK
jgi:hypothetical protein